ncbi:hypothetical protein BH23ACT2_BH23ACT2_08170 [soil metagenome]
MVVRSARPGRLSSVVDMELTLKRLLEQAEFTRAKRGYDANEVDDFLDRAVAMATKVEARLTQALEESKGVQGPKEAKGPAPAEVEAEVERRLQARLAELPASPAPVMASEEETAEEVRRTIVLAQRTADAAVREARQDAARLLGEANERAVALNEEADTTLAAARIEMAREIDAERRIAQERLAGEIGELEATREALRSDVTVLERHVSEQRNQLRTTVGDLQRLLDDPVSLRASPEPALLDPLVPSPIVTARSGERGEGDEGGTGGHRGGGGGGAAGPQGGRGGTGGTRGPAAGGGGGGRSAPVEQTAVKIDEEGSGDSAGPEAASGPPSGGEVDLRDLDRSNAGPPTVRSSSVDAAADRPDPVPNPDEGDEDAFLDELRRAMADDAPLGPRQDSASGSSSESSDEDRRSWPFGKRR